MTNTKSGITYLKALAIWMVVVFHCIVYWFNGGTLAGTVSFEGYQKIIYLLVSIAAVPLFFFISGYLSHKQPLKNYFLKKLWRIVVPFLFFTTIKLVYNLLIAQSSEHGSSVGEQIFRAFVCGELYWFSLVILIMYLIAPLLWWLQDRKKGWIYIVGILSALIIYQVLAEVFKIHLTDILQIHKLLANLPYFILGYLISANKDKITIKNDWLTALIAFAINATLVILFYFNIISFESWSFCFLNCLSAFVWLWFVFNLIPNNIIPLNLIGKYSYQIFFLDSFVRVLLFMLVYKLNIASFWMAMLVSQIEIAICVGICMAVEYIPVACTLFGMKWKRIQRKGKEQTE